MYVCGCWLGSSADIIHLMFRMYKRWSDERMSQKKKKPSATHQYISMSMSRKQRQKTGHICSLYTYTNNTSVKLNKTLNRKRGPRPLNMRIYCSWTQRGSINSQQLHGPIAGASTTNCPPLVALKVSTFLLSFNK